MSLGSVTISAPSLEKLTKNFPTKIKGVIRTSLDQSALAVQGTSKLIVPVLTGHLKRSITYTLNIHNYVATLGTDVIYARRIEFGHSRKAPSGYLRPALEKNKGKIKTIFQKNINKLLKNK